MRQIVLDTETTGLEPSLGHRIIEIGCVEMINRRASGKTFQYYLNPQREIDPGAQEVHGLSNEYLEDKPFFADIADEFLDFVRGAELVIHNAPFDIGFLDKELELAEHDQRIADVQANATAWTRCASVTGSTTPTASCTGLCWMRASWRMFT